MLKWDPRSSGTLGCWEWCLVALVWRRLNAHAAITRSCQSIFLCSVPLQIKHQSQRLFLNPTTSKKAPTMLGDKRNDIFSVNNCISSHSLKHKVARCEICAIWWGRALWRGSLQRRGDGFWDESLPWDTHFELKFGPWLEVSMFTWKPWMCGILVLGGRYLTFTRHSFVSWCF